MWALLVFTLLAAATLAVAPAFAQQSRSVQGTVLDAADNPLPGAVVYLTNPRTHSVRTYITGDDGKFAFHALASNTGFDLHAEYHNTKSGTRSISEYDSRTEIHMDLKVPVGH